MDIVGLWRFQTSSSELYSDEHLGNSSPLLYMCVYVFVCVCVCDCAHVVSPDSRSTQQRRPWYPAESVARLGKSWPERSAVHLTAAHAHCWTGTERRYSAHTDTHTHTHTHRERNPLVLSFTATLCHKCFSSIVWVESHRMRPSLHVYIYVFAYLFQQISLNTFVLWIGTLFRQLTHKNRSSGTCCQHVRNQRKRKKKNPDQTKTNATAELRSTAGLDIRPYQ